MNGRTAFTELNDLAVAVSDGVYVINLDQALPVDTTERHILAEVADNQGNIKRIDVRFYTGNLDIIFIDGFE